MLFPLRHNSHSSKLAFCHNKTSNTIRIQPWDCISLLQYFPTDHKQNCSLDDRGGLPSTYAVTGILPVRQYPLHFSRRGQETYCDRQSKQGRVTSASRGICLSDFHFNIFGKIIKFKTECRKKYLLQVQEISSNLQQPTNSKNWNLFLCKELCLFRVSLSHLKFKWNVDGGLTAYNTSTNSSSEWPELLSEFKKDKEK